MIVGCFAYGFAFALPLGALTDNGGFRHGRGVGAFVYFGNINIVGAVGFLVGGVLILYGVLIQVFSMDAA